mmetsp:Transcript_16932/g.25119  ORF Transcript_16932/g.25119 Transcript_16932/m.25119 type:complete len:129 (-) Transcript_16932:834-1220(-)
MMILHTKQVVLPDNVDPSFNVNGNHPHRHVIRAKSVNTKQFFETKRGSCCNYYIQAQATLRHHTLLLHNNNDKEEEDDFVLFKDLSYVEYQSKERRGSKHFNVDYIDSRRFHQRGTTKCATFPRVNQN